MSNQKVKALIGIAILAVAAMLVARTMRGNQIQGKVPETAWFYDLKTGSLFTASSSLVAPIGTPSEPNSLNGVRAHVYTCSTCDEGNLKVVYVERYSDSAKQALAELQDLQDEQQKSALGRQIDEGRHVALVPVDGAKMNWVPIASDAGSGVVRSLTDVCGPNQRGRLCAPR